MSQSPENIGLLIDDLEADLQVAESPKKLQENLDIIHGLLYGLHLSAEHVLQLERIEIQTEGAIEQLPLKKQVSVCIKQTNTRLAKVIPNNYGLFNNSAAA